MDGIMFLLDQAGREVAALRAENAQLREALATAQTEPSQD